MRDVSVRRAGPAGLALSLMAALATAQTGVNPEKGDLLEPQKIYSPYVERTATDKNFAEGLYWGDTQVPGR